MPFLLNLDTREIIAHHHKPEPFKWVSMIINIYTVTEGGRGHEYTARTVRALVQDQEIIVQTLDDAWDVEYWTRSAYSLSMLPGPPNPLFFPSITV